jgi:hypothetical protein
MTARISKAFNFQAGAYFKNTFCMNVYDVDMEFQIETESMREQNVAVERIKYFINEVLENSIFINQANTEIIDKYIDAELKVCSLPEDPYDQIIAIMLLIKCNTITEGKLILTDISISSRLSDGVYCNHSIEENIGPFRDNGWWSENNDKINLVKTKQKSKKVVKLTKTAMNWGEFYLGWDENNYVETSTSEVVFLNFDNKVK